MTVQNDAAAFRSTAILQRMLALHPKQIDLALDRILCLLHELGDPHLKLPPVIHVAGTNGKGSVCAFSRAMLEAQGMAVHMHISPHRCAFTSASGWRGRKSPRTSWSRP